ncbi:MAG TPA: NUDIX domain-containing protein [Flavitalea sp.]|nr:NUDIX domain-containing protein [Flavitalea sp.]
MNRYSSQKKLLVAVDCIIFGFDGQQLKILLIQRGFEPAKGKWSLMGGFVQPEESCNEAASRILKQLTGLDGVFLKQLQVFSDPHRDPLERTISVTYFALINILDYEKQISDQYHAEWFPVNKFPKLIFDHDEMVNMARRQLRYDAAMHPLLIELLPQRFTLPQLQGLYEDVYNTRLDKRNFARKLLSTGLLIRQADKDKGSSRKGAFLYKINRKAFNQNFLQKDFILGFK